MYGVCMLPGCWQRCLGARFQGQGALMYVLLNSLSWWVGLGGRGAALFSEWVAWRRPYLVFRYWTLEDGVLFLIRLLGGNRSTRVLEWPRLRRGVLRCYFGCRVSLLHRVPAN